MNGALPLTDEQAPVIAAFTRVACPHDLLTTTSVRRSIFADPGPQAVLGVYDGGLDAVGAGVVRGERAFVKFLAVHPASRRAGMGSRLLAAIESFCRESGARSMAVGTSAPYYVVPGVDVRLTDAVCFFEASGYERAGEAVNLTVPLRDLGEPPLPVRRAGPHDLHALREWVADTFPDWMSELERAVALGTCIVHHDLGFACYDVNREGWFGPMATRPGHTGGGIGTATLLGALHAMGAAGHERAEIAWAAAIPFYAKAVDARVSRVFWGYRKDL